MRGGFLHNRLLLAPLSERASDLGCEIREEVRVHDGTRCLFADLVIERDGVRLVLEAELTPRRVERDLRKAHLLHATALWLIAPTPRGVHSLERALARLGNTVPGMGIDVLTPGRAQSRLERLFRSDFPAFPRGKQREINPGGPR